MGLPFDQYCLYNIQCLIAGYLVASIPRLKTLVDECSTQEKTIYALPPKEDAMPDAAASWQKIEQVYGRRSMDQYCKKSTDYVYHQLAHNTRVKNLLTATTPGQDYNSIIVQAGEVVPGSEDAKELIKGHGQMKSKMKGKKKKWAQEFRKQINSYVYRMGNGDQPQTWPLIRKVKLRGPWSVLSTGAVLVDLPGVRDSNAARAKVAESYLQNCNQIAIVAPIKRAGKICSLLITPVHMYTCPAHLTSHVVHNK